MPCAVDCRIPSVSHQTRKSHERTGTYSFAVSPTAAVDCAWSRGILYTVWRRKPGSDEVLRLVWRFSCSNPISCRFRFEERVGRRCGIAIGIASPSVVRTWTFRLCSRAPGVSQSDPATEGKQITGALAARNPLARLLGTPHGVSSRSDLAAKTNRGARPVPPPGS
jgi:hypothetical protein